MKLFGNPPVKPTNDTTDQIGIRTLVLEQMWGVEGVDNPTQTQIDAAKPDVPEVNGGVLLVGTQTLPFGGGYKTFWTFEGIEGDGKTVTFKDRTNTLDYGFEPGFSQLPLQVHPLLLDMLAKYGGIFDPATLQIIWALYKPTNNTSQVGLAVPTPNIAATALNGGFAGSGGNQSPNPMFGAPGLLLDGRDV